MRLHIHVSIKGAPGDCHHPTYSVSSTTIGARSTVALRWLFWSYTKEPSSRTLPFSPPWTILRCRWWWDRPTSSPDTFPQWLPPWRRRASPVNMYCVSRDVSHNVSSPVNMYCLSRDVSHNVSIEGLVQDCSYSIALAMELLQSCTKT